jgi:hypothetical protein
MNSLALVADIQPFLPRLTDFAIIMEDMNANDLSRKKGVQASEDCLFSDALWKTCDLNSAILRSVQCSECHDIDIVLSFFENRTMDNDSRKWNLFRETIGPDIDDEGQDDEEEDVGEVAISLSGVIIVNVAHGNDSSANDSNVELRLDLHNDERADT